MKLSLNVEDPPGGIGSLRGTSRIVSALTGFKRTPSCVRFETLKKPCWSFVRLSRLTLNLVLRSGEFLNWTAISLPG